jgi:hypothetical protein
MFFGRAPAILRETQIVTPLFCDGRGSVLAALKYGNDEAGNGYVSFPVTTLRGSVTHCNYNS